MTDCLLIPKEDLLLQRENRPSRKEKHRLLQKDLLILLDDHPFLIENHPFLPMQLTGSLHLQRDSPTLIKDHPSLKGHRIQIEGPLYPNDHPFLRDLPSTISDNLLHYHLVHPLLQEADHCPHPTHLRQSKVLPVVCYNQVIAITAIMVDKRVVL